MEFAEAQRYVESFLRFSSTPSLHRISTLLSLMGHPEQRLKFVHVAGTNGKGSICNAIATALGEAGYKVGLYCSPHIETIRERIKLNGQNISESDFSEFTERVTPNIQRMVRAGVEMPNQFEVLTAMAFDFFACRNVDIVVAEVGLGGRYDATNVIPFAEVGIITSISLDHTECLGTTPEAIAGEKCGIIKPNMDIVWYPDLKPEVRDVISRSCLENNADLYRPEENELDILETGEEGSRIRYKGIDLKIPLLGRHQIMNMITAVEALTVLRVHGFPIEDEQIRKGIAEVKMPCRMERFPGRPEILIDGGHNPDGITKLCDALRMIYPDRRIITLMGMMRDKSYESCIKMVAALSSQFYAVDFVSARALEASSVEQIARTQCPSTGTVDLTDEDRLRTIMESDPDALVLICGSLHLAEEMRKILLKNNKKNGLM